MGTMTASHGMGALKMTALDTVLPDAVSNVLGPGVLESPQGSLKSEHHRRPGATRRGSYSARLPAASQPWVSE